MEIPVGVKTYVMRSSTIWIDDEGIVYSKPLPYAPLTSTNEEIIEDVRKFKEIVDHKKVCIILETDPRTQQPPKDQRDLIAEQLNSVIKALALITKSPVSKMVINLFFGLKPPAYPTKMFTDIEEARKWIRQRCYS